MTCGGWRVLKDFYMAGKAAIEFVATVYKVQTLVDGGLRATIDLPETAIAEAAALMECQRTKVALIVSMKLVENKRHGKKHEERHESIG